MSETGHTPFYVVIGASRGIGLDMARRLADAGAEVLAVSRSPAAAGTWLQADISAPEGIDAVVTAVGDRPLDALLYLGGTWEEDAFTDAFDLARSTDAETRSVLAVNLVAPIELTRRLAPALAASPNPRAVFIGALTAFDNAAGPEAANTASKFGLRGAVQSLRVALRDENIALTLIHPGNVATPEVVDDIAEGRFEDQKPIPLDDLWALLNLVLTLSPDSELAEVSLAQRRSA